MAGVIITGGNSGIGRATAILFAQKGYQVTIAARRLEALIKVQQEIKEFGGDCSIIPTNVSIAEEVEKLMEHAISQWGTIDVVINAAGVLHSGTILDTDEAAWDRIIDINLKGTFLVNQAALRHMLPRKSGSIVNVASDLGVTGGRNIAAYCASKGGVVLLTKAMALDHSHEGVRVNVLCPGVVTTPMIAEVDEAERAQWESVVPLKRFATAQEVAEAAYFLAHSQYATGSCLLLDGGNTAGGAV
ncbi:MULTISPECIES: SDR family NAD(P)-dependent oxidoreductase [unclassified Tolypothrix]|uniref:SDR family NAD(P)-dependent oxidoreductase n=1 Tax=unclassified Tolypothrix TaxID=2649714 RepID=UPI0005EABBFA|nr:MULTISPECIES: SDR family oxidoreductase [unclassified Tolypothrix]BAY93282.1 short-chain dehydrogenase/reductase SDR [Microchaete diplosiphon NIES-3275]EKF00037.1 oxidoreductase, short chain dehydrogenase/reductase family protein [Tolypothrix sp. PCC 7601]MBE9085340.1 SDR family oxidoreductase [Tolypothrix sp. LEGE 11397]UYD27146.1 SDR family oxidoreductase [Tolypothrix sp. PCC 7712]UYD36996.1 SDR family oxidoreductase [Tolypothrix sp. PCC 7601]